MPPDINFVRSAVANIVDLLDDLGAEALDDAVEAWLRDWDGESLEEVDELDQEHVQGRIRLDGDRIEVDGSVLAVHVAVRIDDVIVIVTDHEAGGVHGRTYPPADPDDPVIVLLDEEDVGDNVLSLKLVLLHELVHVRQVREAGADRDFEDDIPEFETEAHLYTVLGCALVLQQHPDSTNVVEDVREAAEENVEDHGSDVDEGVDFLEQLLRIKELLGGDIADLNATFRELLEELEDANDAASEELERREGELEDRRRQRRRLRRLRRLREAISDGTDALGRFENAKRDAMATHDGLFPQLEDLLELLREREETRATLDELRAEFEEADDDAREELREALEALQERLGELEEEIERLGDSCRDLIRDEVDQLEGADRDGRRADRAVRRLLDALSEALEDAVDDDVIDALAELMRVLRRAAVRVELLRFKLDVMVQLEEWVEDLLD